MLALEETTDGIILAIRAHAGARRNGIAGIHDGALRVAVSQVPEKGKANEAIANLLAEVFGVRKNQIELRIGQSSNQKKFLIRGISAAELLEKVTEILSQLNP